ncbi:ATP-grasp domain-containing protein [Acinetobacter sp. Marseille-Q1618]|uniref:ATP-grasp domain-containing protein n=1 Tax=Acinetobacter sp. Marseille-Q1618 TaxID=2697502 RepID=UPI00156EBC1B|nr:ATP-grasp domain-containing protein [Acinetobacter sp. Marseille-Q1618]
MRDHYIVWIAESFSCQKDIIQALKDSSLAPHLKIICSHSLLRPELQNIADVFIQQPNIADAADWLLQQCIQHKVDVLFCGKRAQYIELHRQQFEKHNIQLITGAMSLNELESIDDKFVFTEKCRTLDLPYIPAIKANCIDTLNTAISQAKQQFGEICAKPVHGVYGAGFVRLKDDINYFQHFKSPFIANTQQFIEAYAQLSQPIDYLIMPYLDGEECSVDIACDQGKILAQVTRIKYQFHQECFLQHPCHEICTQLVQHFNCDGLINIQFKKDQQQQWHILEINARPAGGFAYTLHTGVNLVAALFAKKLNINIACEKAISPVKVLPLVQSFKMD